MAFNTQFSDQFSKTMNPDPAAIAASLDPLRRKALLTAEKIGFVTERSMPISMERLEALHLAEWFYNGRRLTPLGRAVAAAIREREG